MQYAYENEVPDPGCLREPEYDEAAPLLFSNITRSFSLLSNALLTINFYNDLK